jgi:hypothetical protein
VSGKTQARLYDAGRIGIVCLWTYFSESGRCEREPAAITSRPVVSLSQRVGCITHTRSTGGNVIEDAADRGRSDWTRMR